jgi:hydrophobic/amphiphilic exporter-1 (mainly G- bacteria), HAE1 family
MTVALTMSVLLFGVFAYSRLPVSDLPGVDYPVVQVQVGYPGATPVTMALPRRWSASSCRYQGWRW